MFYNFMEEVSKHVLKKYFFLPGPPYATKLIFIV